MMMASDTVPAAVPGPGEPAAGPTSPQANQPRGLAGLLSAVDPARPTGFTLNPTTDTDTGEQTLTGASSDDYHHTPETETGSKSNGTSSGRGQNSVWRAWLLAGAERWKKGADARNKALDIKKVKAQALQVKESRTVNRSEKHVGGSTNTGSSTNSNSGKSLNNKSQNTGNSSGGSHRGSHGGSGGSGRNGAGGGAGGRGSGGGTNSNRRSHNDGSSGKQHRDKHGPGGSGSRPKSTGDKNTSGKGGANNGGKGSQGGAGQQGPKGPSGGKGPAGSPGAGGSSGSGAKGSKSDTATNRTKNNSPAPGPAKVHSPGDSSGRPWKTDKPTSKKTPNSPGEKNTSGPKTPPGTEPVSLHKKPEQGSKGADKASTGNAPKPGAGNTPSNTKTPNTPRTQASRETGYRDGTRAARAANHIVAYRDGVRDGWNDERDRGRHEAQQLDQAHADHKQPQPQQQPTVKVPPMPTHAPTNNREPQPIPVTGIDATHIQLGDGASRTHISRGEVRTLAGFQRKLTDKTDALNRVAERTRALEAHAKAQADKATKLLEQARAVKGGEKLAAALAKLQEAAKVQEGQAAEVRKRAVRATEACTTVAANADTRYGGIYRAVIDSPETAPAELTYYQDLGITNA